MQESEVIVKTESVLVRIMVLTPHEVAEWHYHTHVTDNIFCLTGIILVRMQNPDEEVRLTPGGRCLMEAGRIHQLENCKESTSSYLLVQGIGEYDFNIINKSPTGLPL